ncbi:uncharacterized protein EI90DRAFT_3017325 [Cantharellus anzutake]|uniref:uncharacterized protein n=1 Tax=Cantharellus anzutake TaxID=1750568 RepID=UPI001903B836|nr:uncharacterized protein EI90DRAFT_3017325 [Cantharellus anzutake]KAF8329075.1 hypothetical protein EI90DRAFT_3017325 [Cantharellus anzutake]
MPSPVTHGQEKAGETGDQENGRIDGGKSLPLKTTLYMAIAVILSLILALAGWHYRFTDEERLQKSPLMSNEEEPDMVHKDMENQERSSSLESLGDWYLLKNQKSKPTGRQFYESHHLHPY